MAAFLQCNGRLGKDPSITETRSGKQVANASLAVTDATDGESDATLWVRLTAWESKAQELARYRKGDSLGVVGRLKLHRWTTPDGNERDDLVLTVEQIVGVRPKPRQAGQHAPAGRLGPRAAPARPEFDDELPALV
jgi:single-strand DNA-binding protein